MLWNRLIGWSDLLLFVVMYFISTAGTVGYHRLLTHRAFQTYKPIEYLFAACGSMAVEGPVIGWVIRAMRRLGLAWNVVRITKERQQQKLAEAALPHS